jgi:hypothetical protein
MAPKIAPVKVKAPRQAPPPVNPFLPTSTTVVPKAATGSTSPSTTIPAPTSNPFLNPKSTSPSSGKNFVGPTIDPSLMEARRALSDQQLEAIRSGVDPAVASDIAGGGKNPNRGFIGVGKGIGDLLKKAVPDVLDVTDIPLDIFGTDKNLGQVVGPALGKAGMQVLQTLEGPLKVLSIPRDIILSTLKEVGDEGAALRGTRPRGQAGPSTGGTYNMGAGGFSWGDWVKQSFANTPFGTAGDEFTGGEAFADIKNPYINQALGFVADVALDPVSWTTGPGGLAKTAAGKGVFRASAEVAEAAVKAEIKRGLAIGAKEAAEAAAKQAAKDAIIIGTPAAKAAADDAARLAADGAKVVARLNQKAANTAAPRLYGRTGKEALADSIRQIRQKALDDIANGASGEALDYANAAVAALTDDVIAKVAKDGYAGLTGSYREILAGVKTPAQEVLGVQGGIRIGVPGAKVTIPGTGVVTDILGKGVAGTKGKLVGGRTRNAILDLITPTGAGGLFGEEDILKLRTGLRNGSLKGTNAAQASQILALDKTFRGRVELVRKTVGNILTENFGRGASAKSDFKALQEIADHLRVPQSQWAAKGLAPLTPTQQGAYNNFLSYLSDLDELTVGVAKGTGGFVAAREVLPAVQTTQATRWLANNPKLAEKLAKELGIETEALLTLTGAKLEVGSKFFGRTLTDTDIAGGINRLNEIARESTQKLGKGINFDFFDNNIARSIARYSDNQARAIAKAEIIGSLPQSTGAVFPGSPVGIGTTTPGLLPGLSAPRSNVFVTPANLATLEGRVAAVAADLSQWNKADLDALVNKLKKVASTVKSTLKPEFNRSVDDTIKYIDDIEAGIAAGIIDPTIAAVAGDEATKFATILAQETEGITKTLAGTTPDRWKKVVDIAYDGFVKLDAINAPGVEVHPQIAELFTNIKRLDDPQFAATAEKLLREYNQFFKSYVTGTPGFHVRNALGATIQMISGGADPVNSIRGVKLYAKLWASRKAGLDVKQTVAEAVRAKLIPNTPAARKGLEDILLYSQATGFGQVGEVAERIPGLRPGIFGTTPTGDVPILGRFPIKRPVTKPDSKIGKVMAKIPAREDTIFNKDAAAKASEFAATYVIPLYASRKAGAAIENAVRFAMMFDGVAKGLSPQEAAARTAKFLIDYNDISSVDKVAKQIIPFWMWMSRNTALQAELVWTNPKLYTIYDSARRNLEDEEGTSQYVPDYLRDSGVFKLPGEDTYFKSPFGLVGRGEESTIKSAFEDPFKFLSRVTPALKVPAELFRGKKFLSGAPVVKDGEGNALLYAFQQFNAPGQLVGRYLGFTPLRRKELFKTLTGGTSAELDPRSQELNSLWSLIGAPGFQLTPDQERSEIWRRFFDLEDLINKAKANK